MKVSISVLGWVMLSLVHFGFSVEGRAATLVHGQAYPEWFDLSKLESTFKCNTALFRVDTGSGVMFAKSSDQVESGPFKVLFGADYLIFQTLPTLGGDIALRYESKSSSFQFCVLKGLAGIITSGECNPCNVTNESIL